MQWLTARARAVLTPQCPPRDRVLVLTLLAVLAAALTLTGTRVPDLLAILGGVCTATVTVTTGGLRRPGTP